MTFRSYESVGTVCKGTSQLGTRHLITAVNDLYDHSMNFGIYNCRPNTGGGGLSMHAEGRAVDIGFPGVAHPQGFELLEVLRTNAWELGIQYIVWNRRKYSREFPNGAPYLGPNPHTDHLHVEQVWSVSKTLSLDSAYYWLGDNELTPEQEATLNELVQVRRDLRAMVPQSSLGAIVAAAKLIRLWREIDDKFDGSEI